MFAVGNDPATSDTGSPLSPLLANIALHVLDVDADHRGARCVLLVAERAMVGMVVGHRDNEPHPVHGRNEAAAELAGEVDPGLSFDQRPVCCSRVLGVDVGLGNVGKAV